MSPVVKRAYNDQTRSKYAKAADVMEMLIPRMLSQGFSHSISSSESTKGQDWTRFVLTIRHSGGHVEEHYMDAPVDHLGPKGSPVKTKLHGMGSSYTYCERHLLCKVFGVQLVDDDDGNRIKSAGVITESEAADLNSMADEVGADVSSFKDLFGVDRLEDLPKSSLKAAIWALRQKAR